MPFLSSGTLTTDVREVAVSETWDSQAEWDAAQSKSNVVVESGVVKLAEASVPDEVVTRHQMDEGTGTTVEDSIGTWDFTLNGGTWTSDANSVGGQHISLDGTDDNLDAGDVTTPNQLSVCLWVSFDSPADGTVQSLWDFGINGGNDQGAQIQMRDGSNAADGELRINIGNSATNTGFIPSADTWYHLAMTYASDGTLTFYVDGAQEHQASVGDGTVGDSSRPLRIGEASFGGSNLPADVDDHHIADAALTQSEVQSVMGLSPRG